MFYNHTGKYGPRLRVHTGYPAQLQSILPLGKLCFISSSLYLKARIFLSYDKPKSVSQWPTVMRDSMWVKALKTFSLSTAGLWEELDFNLQSLKYLNYHLNDNLFLYEQEVSLIWWLWALQWWGKSLWFSGPISNAEKQNMLCYWPDWVFSKLI